MTKQLSNKQNLPEAIVIAASQDNYVSMGDISVTGLIDSPRIRQYHKLYGKDIVEDVADKLAAMEGTALHYIMEMADPAGVEPKIIEANIDIFRKKAAEWKHKPEVAAKFTEEADWMYNFLRKSFKNYKQDIITEPIILITVDGIVLKGQMDRVLVTEKAIEDWKKVAVWSYGDEYDTTKWEEQQNIYAYMVYKAGIDKWPKEIRGSIGSQEIVKVKIERLTIIRWYRDWQKMKAKTSSANEYPPKKVMEFNLPVWPIEKTEAFIKERLALHLKAAQDIDSVDCTSRERWATADVWKVYNIGGKRSLRNSYTKDEAIAFAKENEHKYKEGLEVRRFMGESRRCEGYCSFKNKCSQYKRMYGEKGFEQGLYAVEYVTNKT
jgi:hypothetical protein